MFMPILLHESRFAGLSGEYGPKRNASEDPSFGLGRRGMSGPDCRHLLLECRFEMLQRAGRGLARESGEVVHHVHLVVVAEAMGDFGLRTFGQAGHPVSADTNRAMRAGGLGLTHTNLRFCGISCRTEVA